MAAAPDPKLMDRVVNLAKRRGLIFPSSEIYGGFRSTWDYGPLGVLLKRNVKDAWWRSMVQLRDDVVGLDAAILMAPQFGHVWGSSSLSSRNRCRHTLQSTSGSVKFFRWPEASQTAGGDRMAASRQTTSSRICTIERHQASLTLRSINDPRGP